MAKHRPRYTRPLTAKETEVLCLMCLTNDVIAHRTHHTPASVKQIRNAIFKKLKVHTRAAAIITAIRQGTIDIWDVILPTDVYLV